MPDQKPRKELSEAEIINYFGETCLYSPDNDGTRTSQLLRADFEKMEFETRNTIYKVHKLLTS